MPTPRYSIRTITEKSLKAWFDVNAAMLPGTPVVLGQTDSERSVPIVILHAESASAAKDLGAYWKGNFEITVKVYIYSSADDAVTDQQALEDHRARCEAVQAIMMDVAGLQGSWTQGKLYMSKFESDDEGVADRRYGNIMQYTLVAVYPPAA